MTDGSEEVTQRNDQTTKQQVEHFVHDLTSYVFILYDAVLHLTCVLLLVMKFLNKLYFYLAQLQNRLLPALIWPVWITVLLSTLEPSNVCSIKIPKASTEVPQVFKFSLFFKESHRLVSN